MDNPDKLIQKIKEEKITPKPKWYFALKNALIWSLYLLFILIGAISFSIVLFAVQQTDFELLSHIGHSKLEALLSILPIIWLISLIGFIAGSIYSIYNSKRGYKFTFNKIIALSVGLSIVIGTIFFISGGASWFEEAFALRVGFYESIQKKKEKIWQNPEKGNIAGTIIKVDDDKIELQDLDNNKWQIDLHDVFIPRAVFLEKGEKVKITGKKIDDNTFKAEGIYPWGGKNLRKKMQRKFGRHR